jgi:hypothetical protein
MPSSIHDDESSDESVDWRGILTYRSGDFSVNDAISKYSDEEYAVELLK